MRPLARRLQRTLVAVGVLLLPALSGFAAAPADTSAADLVWGDLVIESPIPLENLGFEPELSLRGEPVAMASLEPLIQRVLRTLADAGYPFAVVRPQGFDLDKEGRVGGVLLVEPGSFIRLAALALDGAKVTRPGTALRLAGLHAGQKFTGREPERVRERLLRTGFFLDVGEVTVLPGAGADEVVLRVPVAEPAYTRFRGILGVSGPDSRVTGLVDLDLVNLAGTAREASASWEDRGGGLARYRIRYREPWLPLVPVGVEGSLSHDVNDNRYSFTRWEVLGDLALGPWRFRLGAGGSSATEVLAGGVNSDEDFVVGGIVLDLRNSVLNPTAGWRVETVNHRGSKSFSAVDTASVVPDPVERTRWEAAFEGYRRFGRRWLGALFTGFHYLDSPEPDLPRYDLLSVGGANSLRGYREEQFLTTMAVTLKTEWRLLQGERGSALYGFGDAGWIATDPDPHRRDNPDLFLLGYGLGVRQAAKVGVFGVEYGVARGESPLDGRIHLRLDAVF